MTEIIFRNRLETIQNLFLDSEAVCLAVSFIRNSGVRLLRPVYIQSTASFVALVDIKQRITEKSALMQLLDDNFALKCYIGAGSFHPKVWLFSKNNHWKALVGSMNMSLAALTTGIESCLLVEGREAIEIKDWFYTLWQDSTKTQPLGAGAIRELPDALRLMNTPQSPEEVPYQAQPLDLSGVSDNDITRFIHDWTYDSVQRGQAKRRTGWTFRPAQGDFNRAKRLELQRVLQAMFGSGQEIFSLNDTSARRVQADARIGYARAIHRTSPRGLLIRQQINYLEKLHLVEKVSNNNWDRVQITSQGVAYMRATQAQLSAFIESAIIRFNWFDEVNIYDYTKSLLFIVDRHKVSFDEFFLFVRHGGIGDYSSYTPEDLAHLIMVYRQLSEREKADVWTNMEMWLNANDCSRSQTALLNMVRNWTPGMIEDLAVCSEFIKDHDGLSLSQMP